MKIILLQEYEDDDSHASWGSLRASHAALLKNQRVKRSTVEYYFCLTTSSSQCDSACATQCGNQHALGHTFAQDGKCYAVLDDGSCPGGDNTCSSGFKCSCDIEEITCDK